MNGMKVNELVGDGVCRALTVTEGDREIGGVYIGDLLSWVMGRASADDAWITIMSNINVVAVASLADAACVLFAEGVVPLPSKVQMLNPLSHCLAHLVYLLK